VDPSRLGLYVVTPGGLVPGRDDLEIAVAAIEGGADALQLRAPQVPYDALRELAIAMGERCREGGVLFIVNDRVDVAVDTDADGVHLGQDDDPYRARGAIGDRVLGVSVHTPEQARTAERAGADYLAVTVWATATKPDAVPRSIEGLRAVLAATTLPVIGIGGIGADNADEVFAAGASGIAVISAVAGARDPVAATRELRGIVDRHRHERGAGA
jgi:thiamine-phosphate pyrophosphorylase